MTDDPRIGHQPLHVALSELRHPLRIETRKGFSEVVSLAKYCQPGKTRLKTFQTDLFEQSMIGGLPKAPLTVVIEAVFGRIGPPTNNAVPHPDPRSEELVPPRLSYRGVVATLPVGLGHILGFPRTCSGVRPWFHLPVCARSVL